jgi:hypothetical protein
MHIRSFNQTDLPRLIELTIEAPPERRADAEQRVERGPLGAGIGTSRLHDGPVDADPRQRLPDTRPAAGRHVSRAALPTPARLAP